MTSPRFDVRQDAALLYNTYDSTSPTPVQLYADTWTLTGVGVSYITPATEKNPAVRVFIPWHRVYAVSQTVDEDEDDE